MDPAEGKLFEYLFDQSHNPIAVLKANPPDFTIVALNQQFKRSTNTPTKGAIGISAFELYKPFDKTSVKQFDLLKNGLEEAIQLKGLVKLPMLYFEAPGTGNGAKTRSWWQIEVNPVIIDNRVAFLMCTTWNVTERELLHLTMEEAKLKEVMLKEKMEALNDELSTVNEELTSTIEELSESQQNLMRLNDELELRVDRRTRALMTSEKRLKLMLDSLSAIAWTGTSTGEVTFYNKCWYDYTGLTFEETKALGWKKVIHPDDLEYNISALTAIHNSQKPGEFEIRERGADGIYRWFLVRLQPILDNTGEVEEWIGTATEIDSIKKLQEQKDDFISIASHELKTPLTSLKATLQLLDRMKNKPQEEKLPRMIEQANRSMFKISTLVDDLLNVKHIKDAELYLKKSSFSISELINGCCNHISLTSDHNVIISGDKNLSVNADEQSIDQVIVNLVNNAIKYAPESKDVHIIIEQKGNMAKISVKDNGPGIPREQLPLIFNRYYQAGPSSFRNPGLGLGLYICSEIVKRHAGEIGVYSELGKGSTFWFTLPLPV